MTYSLLFLSICIPFAWACSSKCVYCKLDHIGEYSVLERSSDSGTKYKCLDITEDQQHTNCLFKCAVEVYIRYDRVDAALQLADVKSSNISIKRDCRTSLSTSGLVFKFKSKCKWAQKGNKFHVRCIDDCETELCNNVPFYDMFIKNKERNIVPSCIECLRYNDKDEKEITKNCDKDQVKPCFGYCYNNIYENTGKSKIFTQGCLEFNYKIDPLQDSVINRGRWKYSFCKAEIRVPCNELKSFSTDFFNLDNDYKTIPSAKSCISCFGIRKVDGKATNCEKGLLTNVFMITKCETQCIVYHISDGKRIQFIRGCEGAVDARYLGQNKLFKPLPQINSVDMSCNGCEENYKKINKYRINKKMSKLRFADNTSYQECQLNCTLKGRFNCIAFTHKNDHCIFISAYDTVKASPMYTVEAFVAIEDPKCLFHCMYSCEPAISICNVEDANTYRAMWTYGIPSVTSLKLIMSTKQIASVIRNDENNKYMKILNRVSSIVKYQRKSRYMKMPNSENFNDVNSFPTFYDPEDLMRCVNKEDCKKKNPKKPNAFTNLFGKKKTKLKISDPSPYDGEDGESPFNFKLKDPSSVPATAIKREDSNEIRDSVFESDIDNMIPYNSEASDSDSDLDKETTRLALVAGYADEKDIFANVENVRESVLEKEFNKMIPTNEKSINYESPPSRNLDIIPGNVVEAQDSEDESNTEYRVSTMDPTAMRKLNRMSTLEERPPLTVEMNKDINLSEVKFIDPASKPISPKITFTEPERKSITIDGENPTNDVSVVTVENSNNLKVQPDLSAIIINPNGAKQLSDNFGDNEASSSKSSSRSSSVQDGSLDIPSDIITPEEINQAESQITLLSDSTRRDSDILNLINSPFRGKTLLSDSSRRDSDILSLIHSPFQKKKSKSRFNTFGLKVKDSFAKNLGKIGSSGKNFNNFLSKRIPAYGKLKIKTPPGFFKSKKFIGVGLGALAVLGISSAGLIAIQRGGTNKDEPIYNDNIDMNITNTDQKIVNETSPVEIPEVQTTTIETLEYDENSIETPKPTSRTILEPEDDKGEFVINKDKKKKEGGSNVIILVGIAIVVLPVLVIILIWRGMKTKMKVPTKSFKGSESKTTNKADQRYSITDQPNESVDQISTELLDDSKVQESNQEFEDKLEQTMV